MEPQAQEIPPMSIRAFGRRIGVSAPNILRAIKAGRLKASIVYIPRPGRADVAQIKDPDLAEREYRANTDLTRAPAYVKEREGARTAPPTPPPAAEGVTSHLEPQPNGGALKRNQAPTAEGVPGDGAPQMTLSDAAAHEKFWKAKQAELAYRERAGELVDAAEVENKLVSLFMICRTKLLGVPSKTKAAMPHLTRADIATIDKLIREALEDLSTAKIGDDDDAPTPTVDTAPAAEAVA
jgi:hypothetical protein